MKIYSAVIGMGIGKKHLDAMDGYNNSYVKVICEKNKILRNELKKKYPSKIITRDENQIYQDKSIKIVSIASYDQYHYKQIMKCLNLNKNVIVEKPMCLNLNQLKKIYKLLNKRPKVKITSNLVLRTNSLFNEIKNRIKRKKVYYLEADYLWGRSEKLKGWRSRVREYSVILGAAIHVIDLVMWLLNSRPISVFATGNKIASKGTKFNKNSFELIILEFPKNIKVKITGNAACIFNHFHELKIFAKDETISHTFGGSYVIKKNRKKIEKRKLLGKYPDRQNRKILIRNFIKSVKDNKKDYISKKDLFDVMSVCFYAQKSSKSGKKIKINYLK